MCGVEEEGNDRTLSLNRLGPSGHHYNRSLQSIGGGGETDIQCDEESTARLFVNAFQVATIADGYNSGRSYYLQAESSDVKQRVITQLQALTESARKRAEVKSLFRKAQDRVRKVYVTRIFQTSAALLIVAVSVNVI